MQLYFIRWDKLKKSQFADWDLPEDFLMPIASAQNFEDLFPNITKEHIIMGLVVATTTQRDHPFHREWIKILEKMSSDVLDFFLQKTSDFLDTQDLKNAELTLNFLKNIAPDYHYVTLLEARIHEEKSLEHARNERWDEAQSEKKIALDLYSGLLKADPSPPEVLKYLGLFYFKLGDKTKALEFLQKYLEIFPNEEWLATLVQQELERKKITELFHTAYDKIMMGDEESSLGVLEELLELEKGSWEIWFMKGWAHRRLEQFDLALPAFDHALELKPDHVDILNEKALCLYGLERLDEAEQVWTRTLEWEPMNVKILSNLAILHLRWNNADDARYYLKAVLDIEPDNALMRKLLDDLEALDP